jgi:xylitol oxidase
LVSNALNLIETVLQPYGAMPHWGKVTKFSAHYIRSRYSNFGGFTEFVKEMDPQGVFSNHFLNQLL